MKIMAMKMFEKGLSEEQAQKLVDEALTLKRTTPLGAEDIMSDFKSLQETENSVH